MTLRKSPAAAAIVLKLGGSLLEMAGLRNRLRQVIDAYRPSPVLVVVGGGAAADLVRRWDRVHQPGDEVAHWLALEAMSFNARFVAALMPDADLVTSLSECDAAWGRDRLPIVHAALFVPALETTTGDALPRTWDVTSDSISAWIAECVGSRRLVLLKSVDCRRHGRPEPARDLVDRRFSAMSGRLQCVEWINLRSAVAEPCRIQVDGRHGDC